MSTHASLAEIRHANQRLTLDACYRLGESSSLSDLVEATGLSRPTLTQSLRAMEASGLVESASTRPASGIGRPMAVFRPVADHHRHLVVVIGFDRVEVSLADAFGEIVASHREPLSGSLTGQVAAVLERMLDEGVGPVVGGVIAVMGIVHQGRVVRSNRYPELNDEGALAAMAMPVLRRWPDAEVVLRNDAKLAASYLESWLRGQGIAPQSAIAVHMTEAVGCGLLIAGEVLEGAHGAAGEVGLDSHGPFSLAENELGAGAQELGIARLEVFARSAAGDPASQRVAREVGRQLALGLRSTILALDPELVVVGGPAGGAGEVLRAAFAAGVSDVSLTPPAVIMAEQTGDAVRRGALMLAIDRVRDQLVAQLPAS